MKIKSIIFNNQEIVTTLELRKTHKTVIADSNECPYVIGQILWVKEKFSTNILTEYHYTGNPDDHGGPNDRCCLFAADSMYKCGKKAPKRICGSNEWQSARRMPKWASRINIEINSIKSQKLWDESHHLEEKQAQPDEIAYIKAEGYRGRWDEFAQMWDSNHVKKEHKWDKNPNVWVFGFKSLF